jgi:hypothetical protein
MVLVHAVRIVILWLLLTTVGCYFGASQTQAQSYDPASQRRPEKPGNSFIEFALKRINPSDTDYGRCIDEGRKVVFEETVENGFFWSNIVALSLLGCLFLIVVYQQRRQTRRESIAADALAQYEHALVRANAQVDEATKRNQELMEALTAAREGALRSPLALIECGEPVKENSNFRCGTVLQPSKVSTVKSGPVNAKTETVKVAGDGAKATSQLTLFKPEVDLIVKVNSLEQQLGRSQEQEKQLRRQLNQSELRVQTEQQKNRALKGE